ncbi:MAG: hypothetical protein LBU70_08610 [Chitinispirillales bacterium]|nr:hypothetical protein [Chitinispirillales bacterium]
MTARLSRLAEGRAEGRKKIAKGMKNAGIDVKTIAKITKMTEKERGNI